MRRRRNPSRQAAAGLPLIDADTGLAFAGGMVLGARGLPGWLTLMILGAAEVFFQIARQNGFIKERGLNTAEKIIIDSSAAMLGWWVLVKKES